MSWPAEGWSRLHRVTDRDVDPWYNVCADSPGLYRLIGLTDAVSLTPATLQRVCGPDASGTIYIGSAGNLRPRVGQLVMQHHHDLFRGGGHRPMPVRLERDFPAAKLAVCWRYLPQDVDRYAEERKLIASYMASARLLRSAEASSAQAPRELTTHDPAYSAGGRITRPPSVNRRR